MSELRPCPCGVTPNNLHIYLDGGKWAWVYGTCCAEWSIEFRTNYSDGEELQKLARDAWNEAPRSSVNNTKEQKT